MKIIDNTIEQGIVFGSLKEGDVFRCDNGYIWMVMSKTFDYNAIDLTDGEVVCFNDDEEITPLPNARLVID